MKKIIAVFSAIFVIVQFGRSQSDQQYEEWKFTRSFTTVNVFDSTKTFAAIYNIPNLVFKDLRNYGKPAIFPDAHANGDSMHVGTTRVYLLTQDDWLFTSLSNGLDSIVYTALTLKETDDEQGWEAFISMYCYRKLAEGAGWARMGDIIFEGPYEEMNVFIRSRTYHGTSQSSRASMWASDVPYKQDVVDVTVLLVEEYKRQRKNHLGK